ncbi:transcriptional regulator, partial [Mycobacterium sp. ITM-2017-0098]
VRELEGDREVIDCEGGSPCPLVAGCRLRRALAKAKEAFYAELDQYTVADLARSPALTLIQVAPPAR